MLPVYESFANSYPDDGLSADQIIQIQSLITAIALWRTNDGRLAVIAAARDVILFALAIYGALLSTFNLLQARRRDKRSIVVTVSSAIPGYDNGSLGQAFAKVEAVNAGHGPSRFRRWH